MNIITSMLYTLMVVSIIGADAERTKDKMYEFINTTAACFRILNATHQTGCTSSRGGSTGIIHVIYTRDDIDFIVEHGEASPYILVLPVQLLTEETLQKINSKPDLVSGAIAHINDTRPPYWSAEDSCPNIQSSLNGSCSKSNTWNPHGNGLLHIDWPFPLFLVKEKKELNKIIKCFMKFNNFDYENQPLRALCALELDSHMFAAVDSLTCLRRANSWSVFSTQHYCDPLGDRNIWSTLLPHGTNDTMNVSKNNILIIARTDTTSLFNAITPGADSAVGSVVTLLAIARQMHRLANVTDQKNYKKNVWFIILNGEAYDYIGSQRLVWDITEKKFPSTPLPPLKLEDIDLVVELSQLGLIKNDTVYAHHYGEIFESTEKKFLSDFKQTSGMNVKDVTSRDRFPPASIQSFLKKRLDIPHIVLADHDFPFSNEYYNSLYDDVENIGYEYRNGTPPEDSIQQRFADLADSLAKTIHMIATEQKDVQIPESDDNSTFYVDELMNCYLKKAACRIHRTVGLKDVPEETTPFSLYVGVAGNNNLQTTLTAGALVWLTGVKVNKTQENCKNLKNETYYQYIWMGTTLDAPENCSCFRTTMNMSIAVSPAFDLENNSVNPNGYYSTWTESVWHSLSVRMFLKPSARHEVATVSIGTVTLVLSMALVYFVNNRSRLLFPPQPDCTATSPVIS